VLFVCARLLAISFAYLNKRRNLFLSAYSCKLCMYTEGVIAPEGCYVSTPKRTPVGVSDHVRPLGRALFYKITEG
jgi:hypothetical protein